MKLKQAGNGISRRHIQSTKIAKGLPSVKYSHLQYSKIKNQKNGPSGTPGPASASPWRAKRMTLSKLSTFLSQFPGTVWRKKIKSQNAEKLNGGTLWRFSTSFLSQNIKKLKGGNYLLGKKSHNAKKS